MISTRRFFARPAKVLFVATGFELPIAFLSKETVTWESASSFERNFLTALVRLAARVLAVLLLLDPHTFVDV